MTEHTKKRKWKMVRERNSEWEKDRERKQDRGKKLTKKKREMSE